jgi:hypothetical protein
MTHDRITETNPRGQDAIRELQALIRLHSPAATLTIAPGEDPEGVYLTATVDVDDTDEVVDPFLDRLIDSQVEDGLHLYVIPVRPLARVAEDLQARAGRRSSTVTAPPP